VVSKHPFGQCSAVCELKRYTSLQKFLKGTRPLRICKSGLGSADIIWFQSRHRAASHNKCRKVDIVVGDRPPSTVEDKNRNLSHFLVLSLEASQMVGVNWSDH
jgi:hypothetical protein